MFCHWAHSTSPVLAIRHRGNDKINGCASERDLNVNNEEGTQLRKAHQQSFRVSFATDYDKIVHVTQGSSSDGDPSIWSGMEKQESLGQSYFSCTKLMSPVRSFSPSHSRSSIWFLRSMKRFCVGPTSP